MDGYLGEIRLFAGNFAPKFWQYCHGQLLAIADYQALFSIIGTYYGGDGRTSMGLPDLRSRVPVGVGQSPGHNPYFLGQTGGYESVIMTENQLPAHTHSIQSTASSTLTGDLEVKVPVTAEVEGAVPTNNYIGNSGTSMFGADKGTDFLGAPEVTNTLDVATSVNVTAGQTGGSQPLYNVQPFQSLHYIICVSGLYPQRP